jgi:ABC-type Na+ efflux pump permease subunit
MAPIKFEEHIKEQLEQRSLSPSKNAWSKLDQRLDEHENKSKNKNFWWIGIAASFIGVLLVVSFLFKDEETTIETNVVVETEQSDVIDVESINEKNIINTSKEEQIVDVNQDKVEENINNKQSIETKKGLRLKSTFKPQENLVINTVEDAVAEAKVEKQKTLDELNVNAIKTQDIETLKAKDVVAQILELKETKTEVTDDEIEALLDAAYKEITLQRIYNENTNTVDADALLRDVEFDIEEESFRSKVFEMLKAGYKEVKTAVAERNN